MDCADKRPTAEAHHHDGWVKSSYSSGACTCVEVRYDATAVWIRDSKYLLDSESSPLDQPMIGMSMATWQRFVERILAGPHGFVVGAISARLDTDGSAVFQCLRTAVTLAFETDEFSAFKAGLRAGEFTPPLAA